MNCFAARPMPGALPALRGPEPFLNGHSTTVEPMLSRHLRMPQLPWSWSWHVDAH